jgi:hypothetical protein
MPQRRTRRGAGDPRGDGGAAGRRHADLRARRQLQRVPGAPVLDPEEVAHGIELCAENPKREVTYGRAGRGLEILYAVAPGLYRRIAHPAFVGGSWGQVRADPAPGNVLGSRGPHRVGGNWRSRRRGVLGRAFLGAAGGALRGLYRKSF